MQFPDDTPRRGGDNLLPMINVVFLLLIFFLISAEMTPPEPFEVSSPRGASDGGGERQLHPIHRCAGAIGVQRG